MKGHRPSDLPIVTITVKDQNFQGLVDCGSKINAMQETCANILQRTLRVNLASRYEDNSIMCGGKPRLSNRAIFADKCYISGTKFDGWFYIAPDATDMPK